MHRYPFKKLDFPTQADASFKILEFPSENFHGQSFKFASEIPGKFS
jgi:glutathione peroxidase-family protein